MATDSFAFEADVRRVARALWAEDEGDGAAEMLEGSERDCIFRGEDLTHYLEATTDRSLAITRETVKKMVRTRKRAQGRGDLMKLWFVTKGEPTADQRAECRGANIQALSLEQFKKRLIDAEDYLESRTSYRFGSARDPEREDSSQLGDLKYQSVDAVDVNENALFSVNDCADAVSSGRRVVLLGDYGMGKSLFLFQLFLQLRSRFYKSQTKGRVAPVPLALNLRDHWGQDLPAEALSRHATALGLRRRRQLTRAFNAGQLVPILDGFDEISSTPWSLKDKERVHEARIRAVELVAQFFDQLEPSVGGIVAGREHFFDSREELLGALGLTGSSTILLRLGEFDDQQARAYLRKVGLAHDVPDWIPRRPLLLAELAARGQLDELVQPDGEVSPAAAWSGLLDRVCEREARIHKYLDAGSIRRILETLASGTRQSDDGLGPVTEDDLAEAFRAQTGALPDSTAWPLLMRLPGLTARDTHAGSRRFLDDQLLDACRAGTVARFILDPYSDPKARDWKHGLGGLGLQVVHFLCSRQQPLAGSNLRVAATEAAQRWSSPTLALDMVALSTLEASPVDFGGLEVVGGDLAVLDLAGAEAPQNLVLREATIAELALGDHSGESLILEDCVVAQAFGVADKAGLPDWMKTSEVLEYDAFETSAGILSAKGLALQVRVLLTLLRKLYVQKGHGRRENSLYRGMDPRARQLVDGLLQVLVRQKLAYSMRLRGQTIWHPVAGRRARADAILRAPLQCGDPVIEMAGKL